MRDAFVFIMADWIGAWPGDQPKAVKGMDISMAVFTVRLLTNAMHAVQMELARSRVAAEKMSSRGSEAKEGFHQRPGWFETDMINVKGISDSSNIFKGGGRDKVIVEGQGKDTEIVAFP